MGKPSAEFLPFCAELVPTLVRQQERLLFVAPEHVIQFTCGGRVDDDGIFLKVTFQAACIQVGAAYRAVATVDHHDFGMVESGVKGMSLFDDSMISTFTPLLMAWVSARVTVGISVKYGLIIWMLSLACRMALM